MKHYPAIKGSDGLFRPQDESSVIVSVDDDTASSADESKAVFKHHQATSSPSCEGADGKPHKRNRKVLLAACSLLAILLLSTIVVAALAASGKIKLMAGAEETSEYEKSQSREDSVANGNDSQAAIAAAGEVYLRPGSDLQSGLGAQASKFVVLKQKNEALLDFDSFRLNGDVTVTSGEALTGEGAVTVSVNANFTDYVIFDNLGCHSSTYRMLNASSPSVCGDWCSDNGECLAWTFRSGSGVCDFKRSCSELKPERLARRVVTGIKRGSNDEVIVRIYGSSGKHTSSSDDLDDDDSGMSFDSVDNDDDSDSAETVSYDTSGSSSSSNVTSWGQDSSPRNDDDDSDYDTSGSSAASNATSWIVFQNLGCSGRTYQSMPADHPSQCSDWCTQSRDCSAWTFPTTSGGVCNFKQSCSELATEIDNISGIKGDENGGVTVSIDGGISYNTSEDDDDTTLDDDKHSSDDDADSDDGRQSPRGASDDDTSDDKDDDVSEGLSQDDDSDDDSAR